MRAAILTEKQWQFLANYAAGHGTTLDAIARHLIGTTSKAAKGTDRRYAKDQQRAADAIGVLERHHYAADESAFARAADQLEIKRLRRACDDPALLWAIYRRAEKNATGYGITIQKRKAA